MRSFLQLIMFSRNVAFNKKKKEEVDVFIGALGEDVNKCGKMRL